MKKLWYSLSIIFLVMFCLALPFTSWGFISDDFGFLYHAKNTSLLNIFAAHDVAQTFFPSNAGLVCPSWLAAFYRPMQFVYFALEEMFFGINPYYFLLFMVLVHAFNAVLIFNIFAAVVGTGAAYGSALLFAFHPTLFKDMGILFNQIYIIDLFCLLLASILLWRFMIAGQWWCYVLSCGIFFMQLWAKETLVVMPVWVVLVGLVWQVYEQKSSDFVTKIKRAFMLSSGYWFAFVIYFGLRWWIFSGVPCLQPAESLSSKLIAFVLGQKERFFVWVTYACDVFGISFIFSHGKIIKTGLLVALFLVLLKAFIVRQRMFLFLFLMISMLMFTWPSVLLFHQLRYVYIGLPFLMFAVAYAVDFYVEKYRTLRIPIAAVFCLLVGVSAGTFVCFQKKKENVYHVVTQAFDDLVRDQRTYDKTIIFAGLPMRWLSSGLAQAVWLLQGGKKQEIYYDNSTCLIRQYEGSLPWYGYDYAHYDVTTEWMDGVLHIISHQPDQLFFAHGASEQISLGQRIVHQTNADGMPCHISLRFDQQWLVNPTIFVTWDYQNSRFKIID